MTQEQWTIRDVLAWTRDRFQRAGLDSPRLDAEVLLAHALGCERILLYTDLERPLSPEERTRYRELVAGRLDRRPVAHLLGEKEFWSRRFLVSEQVLVPRPETELLVERGLAALQGVPRPRILDVGTGSGAVAVALAVERPDATVVATDVSAEALALARENAETHGAELSLHEGDLLAALPEGTPPFDLVVANLPYIDEAERASLPPEVQREPAVALFAAEAGLATIRRLVSDAPARALSPGGWLMLEVGLGQAAGVADLMREAGCDGAPEVHADLAGIERVVAARWGG